jgi:hypothetical protein
MTERDDRLSRDFLDGDRLMPMGEVAALFAVSRQTAARWAAAGQFPDLPDGRPSVIRTPTGGRGVYRVRASVVRGLLDGTLTMREATDGD